MDGQVVEASRAVLAAIRHLPLHLVDVGHAEPYGWSARVELLEPRQDDELRGVA